MIRAVHECPVLSVGGSFVYFERNARCTVTTDLLVWYADTRNDFSPAAAVFDKRSEVELSVVGWSLNGKKWNVDRCSEAYLGEV
jgi:hypothetical protein